QLFTYKWDFGDGTPIVILSQQPLQNISHTFATAGTFNVTLTVTGACGSTSITKTICIEAPIVPLFALNNNDGCGPLAVTATNTTSLAASCNPPSYAWNVSYSAANCGSGPVSIPVQTTQNATYSFT